MMPNDAISDPTVQEIRIRLTLISSQAAVALGLLRVLTLLPIHDPALDEIEEHMADVWESVLRLSLRLEGDSPSAPDCHSN